ncbi:hypothetical protein V4F39_27080 [Aquincola sp. MAHUQ-54]|uniref:Transmembrane protein n=1 Tax=Aquincola agrisoli TaxID=3119538 RepID=A0AAW9QMN4_9BURK
MLLRWIRHLLQWALALLVLFEEWGWEPLQRALARLARWGWIAALERWVASLTPHGALVLFVAPTALLLPVKLLALGLAGRGHVAAALGIIVLAKVVGTAVVARTFQLVRPALMRLAWFARGYAAWEGWKTHWLARVRRSWPWRAAAVARRAAARRLARWLKA